MFFFLHRGYITCIHIRSYDVHDFALLLACGDCPDDGWLLSLHFEEGSLLPVLLSCSGLLSLDGIIGPKRDGLSRHTRFSHLNLCSSKVSLEMLVVNLTWRFLYYHCSFVPLCFVHSICSFERHRNELSLRPNPQISNLN